LLVTYIYTPLLAAVIVLMASLHSYAINVLVSPPEVVPGDVFLLKITSADNAPVEVTFLDRKVDLYPSEWGLISLIPLDVNTSPGKHKIHVRHGGDISIASVEVKSHTFRSIKLTLPEEKVTLSPEDQKRVDKEYGLQQDIWGKNTKPVWDGQFAAPLDTEISTEFGVRRIMNEKKTSVHRGMDFRGKTGIPVKALNAGTVVLSQDLFYGGNTVVVDHGMGLYSVYMHLSKFNVHNNSKVEKGQVIGFVGSSGRATGPHLHLSVKLNGLSVNPESLFKLEL